MSTLTVLGLILFGIVIGLVGGFYLGVLGAHNVIVNSLKENGIDLEILEEGKESYVSPIHTIEQEGDMYYLYSEDNVFLAQGETIAELAYKMIGHDYPIDARLGDKQYVFFAGDILPEVQK